jgi:hypothetical protein
MNEASVVEYREIPELLELIEGYPYKPYFQYPQFDNETLSEAFLKEVQTIAANRENQIIAIKEKQHTVAFCIVKKAVIESGVFHKDIYGITHLISTGSYKGSVSNKQELIGFFTRHHMNHIGMVSCRANSNDFSTIHALEKEAFCYMDNLATYSFNLKQTPPEYKISQHSVRPVQNEDCNTLKNIISGSQFMDRFHKDPHIPKEKSNLLYETFIDNAMKGVGADTILVAETKGKLSGFNTIETNNLVYLPYGVKVGTFVLNAVSPEFRNQRVYSDLMHESLWHVKEATDLIEMRVHVGNFPVHRALPKIGFRLSLSQLTFHVWNTTLMPLSGTGV